MLRTLLLLVSLTPLAFGQNTQVGGVIGRGGVAKFFFENSAYHIVTGLEGCVMCGGRLGLFLEYHHWSKTGTGTDQPVSLDVACGGLRIQGKGSRVRPFIDFGLLAGTEKKDSPFLPFQVERQGAFGGVIGFGAAIPVTEHWYVRPLARVVLLSSQEFGGFAGVAGGYRF